MRLSLRVQRQSLPPIDLLWTIKLPRGHTSPTISQLLEEVNQRIPLEGQGWGLEDYVVRVGGFECLHYSEVDDVLRDGDQVSIEPLETVDIRARRLGGRYQITPDGRHLIDGVSFGRRWYGQPARPPVRIPPRKRVKYTDDEEDELDQKAEMLLRLLGSFQDVKAPTEQHDENDNDSDWVMDGDDNDSDLSDGEHDLEDRRQEDSSELDEEVEALAQEAGLNGFRGKYAAPDVPQPKRRVARGKGILKGPETRAKNSNKRKSVGFVPDTSQALGTSKAGVKSPSNVPRDLLAQQKDPACEPRTDQSIGSRVVELGSDEDSDASFSLSDSLSYSSGSFSDSGSSSSGDSSSAEDSSEIASSSDESNSAAQGVKRKRDANSRVHNSSLDKRGLKVVQIAKNMWQLKAKDYDEKSQEAPKGFQPSTAVSSAGAQPNRADTSPSSANGAGNSSSNGKAATPHVSPPGEGLTKTKYRNERRRITNKIKALKRKGLLPIQANKVDFEKFMSNAKSETVETKREKLLAAVAGGGVDVNDKELLPGAADHDRTNAKVPDRNDSEKDSTQTKTGISEPQATSPSPPFSTAREQPEHPSATDMNDSGKENVSPANPLVNAKPTQNESVRRRAKLDLARSRRMLFGSLGVRTPKSQAEEEQLRSRLAEVGKPRRRAPVTNTAAIAHENSETTEGPGTEMANAEKDPNFWKTRIKLFAVECVDENDRLSTPPFPFVQRWDYQQQLPRKSSKSGGKGKKRKRNNSQYYQGPDNDQEYSEWQGIEDGQPDRDNILLNYDEEDGMDAEPAPKARRIDQSSNNVASPGKQLLNEMNGAASTHPSQSPTETYIENEDDLPPIPEDMSALPAITFKDLSPGTIIAFRKLDMSAKTNYQPILSTYRTARIITVDSLTQYVSLQLAKRDQETKSQRYDSEGNRIYGKFEMAEDEDEDSEDEDEDESGEDGTDKEGNGTLNIAFADLVDPKIVMAAGTVTENVGMGDAGQGHVGGETVAEEKEDGRASPSLAVETSESVDGLVG